MDVLRGDIRDLRDHIDKKFDGLDERLRKVEQQSAVARAMAYLGLTSVPFAVAAFSAVVYHFLNH